MYKVTGCGLQTVYMHLIVFYCERSSWLKKVVLTMDQFSKIKQPLNPHKHSNILSRITFSYTLPIFYKAFTKKVINEEEIPQILASHEATKLGNKLEECWKYQKSKKKPLLWIALCRAFGVEFLMMGLILVIDHLALRVLLAQSLVQLVRYFARVDKNNENKHDAYMYGGLIIIYSVLCAFILEWSLMLLRILGMKMRVACSSLIYRKSLKLSKTALEEVGLGHITNLLSNDLARFDSAILFIHFFWICALQIVEVLVILYVVVGITSAVGIGLMVLWFPVFVLFGRKCSELRLKTALKTDVRVQLMNEIINGIKVIKMYTWEKPFTKLVENARREELHQIQKVNNVRGLMRLAALIPKVAIFATTITYVLTGYNITAGYVFAITCYFDILKNTLISSNIVGVQYFSELLISIKRVEKLLLLEEKTNTIGIQRTTTAITLEEVTARWSKSLQIPTLNKVTLAAQAKQFVGIVGPVGSGKSSVFQVIMKELPVESGLIDVHGTISYASQQPWIFQGNVQQNVLFGQQMNEERYKAVLKACALEHDLSLLPYGDKTLVGDKGVNLSGGQKARINLARALYIKADIYLLDDPFAALDIQVANQVFHQVFTNILSDKCVLLITHHLEYLHSFNRIYLLQNGTVSDSGGYNKVSQTNFFKKLKNITEHKKAAIRCDTNSTILEKQKDPEKVQEFRSVGIVSKDIYVKYITSGGSKKLSVVVLLSFLLVMVSSICVDYFPVYWINHLQASEISVEPETSTKRKVSVYTGIVLLVIVVSVIRTFVYFKMTTKISTQLHSDMFNKVLCTSMNFFCTNSSGRILNRFSKDLGMVDEIIPITLMEFLQSLLFAVGAVIMICMTNMWLILVSVLLSVVYYFFRAIYLTTSQNLTRLEGTARSPIYSHINESLQGVITVRACQREAILQDEFDKHLDFHSSVYFLFLACTRTFSFYTDLVCAFYVAAIVLSVVLNNTEQYAGNVGLAISQAIILLGTFQWIIIFSTDLENKMTSVERVIEYTKHPPEDEPDKPDPPANWPQKGTITFESLFLQYAENQPYALKNLNVTIEASQKIGIVGRTGAGKSSLIAALFQLAKTKGALYIDGVDITKVPTQSVRSKISIIPQDPVLFSGSIRQNLDPFAVYTDEDLWSCLAEVQLKETISNLPMGLDYTVSKEGANFSVGQRQLICLARAIVRKNIIIVLDEATANVDPHNDALIQSILKRKFATSTVLTIAHRIKTVIDSDKVLVMEDGEIIEFDHPHLLLQNKNGMFYSMVQKTGDGTLEYLSNVAKDNYTDKMM